MKPKTQRSGANSLLLSLILWDVVNVHVKLVVVERQESLDLRAL